MPTGSFRRVRARPSSRAKEGCTVAEGSPTGRGPEPCTAPLLGGTQLLSQQRPLVPQRGRFGDSAEPIPAWALPWEGAPSGAPGRQPASLGPHKPGRTCFLQKIVYSAHFRQLIPPPARGQQLLKTERSGPKDILHSVPEESFLAPAVRPRVGQGAALPAPALQACRWLTARSPLGHPWSGVLRAPTPPPRPPSLQQGGRGTTGSQVPALWGAAGGIAKPSLSTWARAPSPVLGPLRLGPRGWSPAWTSRPQGRQSRLTLALGLPRVGGCS